MSEEVKEMIDTATNLIFIAAVLFVALMFFGLRTQYANTMVERQAAESRIATENRYKEFNFAAVDGHAVISAITAYAKDTPMYVTGAYNFVNGEVNENLVYDRQALHRGTPWGTVSTSVDPRTDPEGLQAIYRKEAVYYAILTYDSDTPEQLVRDLGLDTEAGRQIGAPHNASVANKVSWLNTRYDSVRPNGRHGFTVSGILFVCIDLEGISSATTAYQQVSLH